METCFVALHFLHKNLHAYCELWWGVYCTVQVWGLGDLTFGRRLEVGVLARRAQLSNRHLRAGCEPRLCRSPHPHC